jgi:transposase-like protein
LNQGAATRSEGSMRKSDFTGEEILAILGELDRDPVAAVAQRHDVSKQTIYVWKKRFGSSKESRHGSDWESLKPDLGEPLGSDLEHFCAVHYGAPEINVVREAVRTFIDDRLARDPELKKRFDKVQQDHTRNRNKTPQNHLPVFQRNRAALFSLTVAVSAI